jgi:hypothetical protein
LSDVMGSDHCPIGLEIELWTFHLFIVKNLAVKTL